MFLDDWAAAWGIHRGALRELLRIYGTLPAINVDTENLSEAANLNIIRLEASVKGLRLFRNNVGATYTKDGSFLRYGLANESKKLNNEIKSADLIGIRPVIITYDMVGKTIGQFVSREVKHAGWKYTGTDRERAQLRWAELITAFGGDACFAAGEGTL